MIIFISFSCLRKKKITTNQKYNIHIYTTEKILDLDYINNNEWVNTYRFSFYSGVIRDCIPKGSKQYDFSIDVETKKQDSFYVYLNYKNMIEVFCKFNILRYIMFKFYEVQDSFIYPRFDFLIDYYIQDKVNKKTEIKDMKYYFYYGKDSHRSIIKYNTFKYLIDYQYNFSYDINVEDFYKDGIVDFSYLCVLSMILPNNIYINIYRSFLEVIRDILFDLDKVSLDKISRDLLDKYIQKENINQIQVYIKHSIFFMYSILSYVYLSSICISLRDKSYQTIQNNDPCFEVFVIYVIPIKKDKYDQYITYYNIKLRDSHYKTKTKILKDKYINIDTHIHNVIFNLMKNNFDCFIY